MQKSKKAVSGIVTMILIILLVLAAIVILWNVVKKTITEQSGEIDVEILGVDVNIEKASVYINESAGNLSLTLSRGADNVNIFSMKIIILGTENSATYVLNETSNCQFPKSLETRTCVFDIAGLGNITKVSVYPISQEGKIGIPEEYDATKHQESSPPNNWTGNLTLPEGGNITIETIPYKQTGIGLEGMENFDELPYFKEHVQVYQFSSFDRTGGNSNDGFNGKYSYLYKEGSNFVIFDDYGPGGIYQIWMTGTSLDNTGRILFYFDDESTPRIDATIGEFFSGSTSPFLSPLAGTISYTKNSFVPILFKNRLKIVMTKQPYFYHFTYHKYDSSVNIEDYTGTEDYSKVRSMWNNKGNHPTGDEGAQIASGIQNINVGEKKIILDYSGADYNYISTIKLGLSNRDESTIQNAWIKIYWDNEASASVEAPIGEFFGSGLQEYQIQSLAIGMRASEYYSFFPMPFSSSAKIEINNSGNSAFSVNYTIKAKEDSDMRAGINAGYFHAKYNKEFQTQTDKDYEILSATGRGHYVGVIHTMRGLSGTDSYFLEGDERFFIDGSKSPAMHGTGTEDYYLGAYYFSGKPYDKAMFGVRSRTLTNIQYSVYRFQINDFVPFTNSVNLGIEHGALNSAILRENGNYSSVAFYYATDASSTTLTDELNIGEVSDEEGHSYSIIGENWNGNLNANYAGYDLNTPKTASDNGRQFSNGNSEFTASIDENNKGVILRRRLDYSLINQLGEVYVDGNYVGKWYTAGMHDIYNPLSTIRWLDSDFYIPLEFTRGKSSVNIRIESNSWNEFYYWVYSRK